MSKWGETIGKPIGMVTPEEFHEYVKGLRIDYKKQDLDKRKAEGKLVGVTVRFNDLGTLIMTNTRKPIKYITMEELEFLSTYHGVGINTLYNKAIERNMTVFKTEQNAKEAAKKVEEIPWT